MARFPLAAPPPLLGRSHGQRSFALTRVHVEQKSWGYYRTLSTAISWQMDGTHSVAYQALMTVLPTPIRSSSKAFFDF